MRPLFMKAYLRLNCGKVARSVALALSLLLCGESRTVAQPGRASSTNTQKSFNVRDFGAHADGVAKDTDALQKALDAAASKGGGMVLVPRGVYLIGSIVIGPNTTLQFEPGANLCGSPDIADYPLVKVRWEGEFASGHRALISAEKAANVIISGPGAVFGPPLPLSRLRNPRGPALIELTDCTNAVLENFSTQYQQLWSIHVLFCQNLTVSNLTVRSINPNGDGLDVDSCKDVLIENCRIDTGDDAISLKSGRGMEAVRLARPTENVVIKDCSLISSIFAGLGIGSEMSGGIRNVRLENCDISGRQNGILIKSRNGRGGFIEGLSCEHLTLRGSRTFLAIDLLNKGIQASEPVTGAVEQWAKVRNLSFDDIRVENVGELVAAERIPAERPLEGLALTRISGTCSKAVTLANMSRVKLEEINVSGFGGQLLTLTNVQGAGLTQR